NAARDQAAAAARWALVGSGAGRRRRIVRGLALGLVGPAVARRGAAFGDDAAGAVEVAALRDLLADFEVLLELHQRVGAALGVTVLPAASFQIGPRTRERKQAALAHRRGQLRHPIIQLLGLIF